METKIRNFKNEHSKNCVVFGVFDACRNAFGEINDVQVRRELTRQRDQSQLNDRQGNFFLIFSSEPTKPTDSVGVTRALFNYLIEQQRDNNGILLLPDALLYFRHGGAELLNGCEAPL